MYKVTYRTDLSETVVIETKKFETYRSAMYFATKFQADGLILEIKWCPKEKVKL